jgi:dTDP-glucose 4,6-dehydratase
VGSHLCDALLARGHQVICVDDSRTGSVANLRHLQNHEGFTFLLADVQAPLLIPQPLDYIYHLASPASPADYMRMPVTTLLVGARGTHNAIGLAKAKRARFLLASTSEVYGDPEVHPQPETYWGNVNPIGPRSVYDQAKRYAEALTMAYARTQGLDAVIARLFNGYGPRLRPWDGRVIPTMLRQATEGEPLTIHGDGSQTRAFTYIDDVTEGLIQLAESDLQQPINIGNPEEHTILELAETVIRLTGSASAIRFLALPEDDPMRRCPDVTAARELLGWTPAVSLEEGLERTLASMHAFA